VRVVEEMQSTPSKTGVTPEPARAVVFWMVHAVAVPPLGEIPCHPPGDRRDSLRARTP
jgi:hypothetical protein